MQAFRHWLPDDTAAPVALRAAFADMVAKWSSKWFTGAPVDITRPLTRRHGHGPRPARSWQTNGAGLTIGLDDGARRVIATRIVGLQAGDQLGDPDRRLLEAVADECLEELKRDCCRLADLPSDAVWSTTPWSDADGYTLEIGVGNDRVRLSVEMTGACFARLVGRSLPPPALRPMGDARAALAGVPVTVSAAVGGCSVTLAELEHLGIGDVLILDRLATDALPLVIDGRAAPKGSCVATAIEGGMGLKINIAVMG